MLTEVNNFFYKLSEDCRKSYDYLRGSDDSSPLEQERVSLTAMRIIGVASVAFACHTFFKSLPTIACFLLALDLLIVGNERQRLLEAKTLSSYTTVNSAFGNFKTLFQLGTKGEDAYVLKNTYILKHLDSLVSSLFNK